LQNREQALKAVEYGLDRKALKPVLMDLTKLTSMTDYFVILSGTNSRQVEAIADGIIKSFRENEQIDVLHKESDRISKWVLLDYGDIIIHVFDEEAREYYDLERLWSDAKIEEIL